MARRQITLKLVIQEVPEHQMLQSVPVVILSVPEIKIPIKPARGAAVTSMLDSHVIRSLEPVNASIIHVAITVKHVALGTMVTR